MAQIFMAGVNPLGIFGETYKHGKVEKVKSYSGKMSDPYGISSKSHAIQSFGLSWKAVQAKSLQGLFTKALLSLQIDCFNIKEYKSDSRSAYVLHGWPLGINANINMC